MAKTFEAIEQLSHSQFEDLCRMYQGEWWSKDRQREDVRRMLMHTDEIVAFCDPDSRRLIAFSRVLTDYVYKAMVFDVIVAAPYRKEGVGRALLDAIVAHPRLGSVQHIELYCRPELVPFYRKWGFTDELGEFRFMRRQRPADRLGLHARAPGSLAS